MFRVFLFKCPDACTGDRCSVQSSVHLEETVKYEGPGGARNKILVMFRNNKGIRNGLNLVSECKDAEDKSGKAARRTVLILVDDIYRIQAQSAIVDVAPITLQLLLGCPDKE